MPAGTFYIAPGTPKPNAALANTWTWFSEGTSSYNSLQVDLKRRFSKGLTLRGVYTWSRALDDGDSLNGTAAGNAPGLVSNPYDIKADWGLATYDVRNMGVITASYDLPFGSKRRYLGSEAGAFGQLVGGWTVNSIVTAQSGFPFTPQLGLQPIEQRRHAQPGSAVSESRLHRPGDSGNPRAVVQSQCFHRAAE